MYGHVVHKRNLRDIVHPLGYAPLYATSSTAFGKYSPIFKTVQNKLLPPFMQGQGNSWFCCWRPRAPPMHASKSPWPRKSWNRSSKECPCMACFLGLASRSLLIVKSFWSDSEFSGSKPSPNGGPRRSRTDAQFAVCRPTPLAGLSQSAAALCDDFSTRCSSSEVDNPYTSGLQANARPERCKSLA